MIWKPGHIITVRSAFIISTSGQFFVQQNIIMLPPVLNVYQDFFLLDINSVIIAFHYKHMVYIAVFWTKRDFLLS